MVIGIDLDTTCLCMTVQKNGWVEIISNEHVKGITSEYVPYTDSERLIGDGVKNRAMSDPKRTVSNVKWVISRR